MVVYRTFFFWLAIICSLQAYPYFKEDQDINTHKASSRICHLKPNARFKETPHLSIAEVKAQLHDRLLVKRVFSQVIGGFVGTLGGRNFHVASNTAAIALDYNMLPTLTDAATRAYVAQQALPALAIFLTTPQGMAVAAALGVAYWSKDKIIDFIKDDIGLLIKVYEMSMQAMAYAMDADMDAGKPKVNSTPIHQQNDQTLTTPMPEQQPILPGYEADPRATIADIEGFSVYNGPDMRVLEQRVTQKLAEREFKSLSGKIHETPISWTSPTGTGQTYTVWQRTDIDWNMVRTAGRKEFIGKTNTEAAKAGLAPQLPDGHFATLHHIGQNNYGPLVEASRRYHGIDRRRAGHDVIHSLYGQNTNHPTNPVDHNIFTKETSAYWKARVSNEF